MSSAPLYLAAAGCGGRLRQVVQHLLKVLDRPVVIRVYDPNPASITAARNDWKAEIVPCASWEEALSHREVEWALVGSWNVSHREHVETAFAAGKNVFAEKPLATNLEDCLAMHAAWQRSGKLFFFGLVLRYAPLYRRIFASSRPDSIGKIVSFEFNETLRFNHGGFIHGNWRRYRANAGTHILEKCCHDIDIAQWLIGSLPVKVASFGGLNFFTPENRHVAEAIGRDKQGRLAYQTWADPARHDPFDGKQEIVDNQVVILEYANGVRATFHTNCNAGLHERRFYLVGAAGAVRADASTGLIEREVLSFTPKIEKELVDITDGHDGGHAGGDGVMARHLATSILHGEQPVAGMKEALEAAVTCFGIDQALDEGRVVDLLPLWHAAGIEINAGRPEVALAH
ncbi:MAG TPA: Gfo/Idh/MocA family oxidoreductase [Rariglobus sp.]